MKTKLIILLLSTIFIASCSIELGETGNIISQKRSTSNFTKINLIGDSDLEIIKGEAISIAVIDYKDIVLNTTTTITNNTLVINFIRKPMKTKYSKAKVIITIPDQLEDIAIEGDGNTTISGNFSSIKTISTKGDGNIICNKSSSYKSIFLKIAGDGNTELIGTIENLDLSSSGDGKINFKDLIAKNANVFISGDGNTTINVKESLIATNIGDGNIYYYGDPKTTLKNTGSGNIIKK